MTPGATWLALAAMGVLPLAALRIVRRGQPEHPTRVDPLRFGVLYAGIVLLLAGAELIDGLPAAFGALGLTFALLGLGVGVATLYRFLYGNPWLAAHPGVAARDIARWQRVTLVAAIVCLGFGLVLALAAIDVAHAPQ